MATQYTDKLKLALPTQGELSGTWGTVVNDNITAMIEEAIAGRSVINTWTANAHTLTTADGTTSESRCAMLEFTDTGTALTGAGQVICPAKSKMYVAKNGAGQTITVKTSSGTGIAIPDGETMWVYCNGTNVEEAVTYINTLGVGTVDIDGGTIDGVSIGNTTPATKAVIDDITIDGGTVGTTSNSLTLSTTTSGDLTITSADSVDINSGAGTGEDITLDQLSIEDNGFTISTATDGNLTIDPSGTTSVVNVSKNLDMPDDRYLRLGNTQNLVIGHANFYQTNVVDSDDNLILFSQGSITLSHGPTSPFSGAENMLRANGDGSVDLYYNNAKKFETTNGGAQVTGTLVTDGLSMGDTETAAFGDSDDLTIQHDGTHSMIKNTGTLQIQSDELYIRDHPSGNYMAIFSSTGNSSFRYGPTNSTKLTITTSGVTVGGELTVTSHIDVGDNDKIKIGASDDLQIYHDGSNSFIDNTAGSIAPLRIRGYGTAFTDDDGSDAFIEHSSSNYPTGQWGIKLYHNNMGNSSLKFKTTQEGVDVTGGVVSEIQINAQTGTTYTTVLADQCKLVTLDNSSAITLTVPPNSSVAYPTGSKIDLLAKGAGQVTVAAGSGVTVNTSQTLKLRAQWSAASLIKLATDTWVLVGDLEAS